MGARCPHCQAELPESSSFCAACGRRIEGWSAVPPPTESQPLPGGQEPTRQMEPTPSLLRAAALSRQKPASKTPAPSRAPSTTGPIETESAMMRAFKRPRAPLVFLLLLLAGSAAAGGFLVVRRHAVATSPPPPTVAVAPPPAAPAPPPAPVEPPKRAKPAARAKTQHREGAVTVTKDGVVMSPAPKATAPAPIAATSPASKPAPVDKPAKPAPVASAPKPAHPAPAPSGALPHKSASTDSRASKDAPAATPPPLDEEGVTETTPLTEEELKSQAEASIDADGVRFVVKTHGAQVRACYERVFKESSPGGRVEIGFAINTEGRAVRVKTETNTTPSEQLGKCLEQRVKEWQFPRPVGGDYELIYPFVFSQGS